MWATLNEFANNHVGLSILVTTVLMFMFFFAVRVWVNLHNMISDMFAGNLRNRWDTWSLLKKILFVIASFIVLIGWICFALLSVIAVIITVGAVSNLIKSQ